MTRIILDPSQSSLSCGSSNLAGAGSILSPLISTLIEAPHTNQSPINPDFLLQTSPFFLILPSPPHILLTLLQPCHKSPKKSSPPAPPSLQSLTLCLTHANLLLSSPPHCTHNLKLIVSLISQFVPPWFFRHNLKPSPNLIGEDPHCQEQQFCNDDDPPPPLHPDQFCPHSSEQAFFCVPANLPVIAPA